MGQSENNIHDELIDQLVIKVTELEKRKIAVPDYTQFFEALQKLMEQWQDDQLNGQVELKAIIEKLSVAQDAIKLQEVVTGAKEILNETRKLLPVTHKHHFDLKTRPWIMSGVLLLLVTAVSTGFAFDLYRENAMLKKDNIKFRMIEQGYPDAATWADTTYANDPHKAENVTTKFEELAKVKKSIGYEKTNRRKH